MALWVRLYVEYECLLALNCVTFVPSLTAIYLGCRAILLSLLVLAQEGQSVKYSLNILLTCTLYFYSVPAV